MSIIYLQQDVSASNPGIFRPQTYDINLSNGELYIPNWHVILLRSFLRFDSFKFLFISSPVELFF